MTNKEFLIEVQKSCHAESSQCVMLLNNLQKVLANAAVEQIPVIIEDLGVFTSHKHPEYIQEDAQTGAMTLYPPRISYRMQSDSSEGAVSAVDLLSEFAKVDKEQVSAFLKAVSKVINERLKNDEEVELAGIGVFSNVLTHNSELQHITFAPNEQMKELVNAPFSCFEPLEITEGKVIPEEAQQVEEIEEKVHEEQFIEEPKDVLIAQEIIAEKTEQVSSQQEEVNPETMTPPVENPEEQLIAIKQNKIMKSDSTNRLLYAAIALVLLACGFLVWIMFGDDTSSSNKELIEAVVIDDPEYKSERIHRQFNPLEETKEDTERVSIAEPLDSVVTEAPSKDETKSSKDEVKPEKKDEAKPENKNEVKPEKKDEVKPVTDQIKPANDVKSASEEAKLVKVQVNPKEFHRMKDAEGNYVTVKLKTGERLTLVALDHFGDKAFWPYIFDVNADKLKSPSLVQSGMTLYLPDPTYYDIDANNPASLQKAKNRGAQLLKK